jgi:hypothetical protein
VKKVISLVARAKNFVGSLSRENLTSPAPGRGRLFVSLFIVAYLFWQLAVPLSYYLGDNESDERFSWRMFSALGQVLKPCLVQIREFPTSPEREVEKQFRAMFKNWEPIIRKNPKPVADKFLQAVCKKSPKVNEILIVRKCPQDWGPQRISGYLRLNCKTGERSGSLHTQ